MHKSINNNVFFWDQKKLLSFCFCENKYGITVEQFV